MAHGSLGSMTLRLKELRKSRKWTQADLASMLGISPSHVSEMEKGKKNPSRPLLEQLAALFEVPIADMYEPEASDPSVQAMVAGMFSLSPADRQVVLDLVAALQRKQAEK